MSESTLILCEIGPLTLTAYGLCMAVGALVSMALVILLARKTVGAEAAFTAGLVAAPFALVGARLMYVLTMIESILVDWGLGFIPQLWQGGYTLYGALLGGVLGVWVYAKAARKNAAPLMDAVAPGAALMLVFARLAERFTTQGLGEYIEAEAFQCFPFAVQGPWGEWQIPVFFYEALAAAVTLIVVLLMRGAKPGCKAEVVLILISVMQIMLESLREDEFIRFGFVRFNQLAAALTLAALMAMRVIRQVKANGWQKWSIWRIALLLAGAGIIIALEFALDKSSIDNTILYFVMFGTICMMGAAMLIEPKNGAKG